MQGLAFTAHLYRRSPLRRNSLGGRSLDDPESQLGGFPLELFDLYLPVLRLVGSLFAERRVNRAAAVQRDSGFGVGGTEGSWTVHRNQHVPRFSPAAICASWWPSLCAPIRCRKTRKRMLART